jgi:hypothetical protein
MMTRDGSSNHAASDYAILAVLLSPLPFGLHILLSPLSFSLALGRERSLRPCNDLKQTEDVLLIIKIIMD